MSWITGLSLRGRTVLVGSVLSAALIAVGAAVPIPYVAVGPGVTYNTLGSVDGTEVISFSGEGIPASVDESYPDSHLNMTTISIKDHMTLFAALGLWATGDYSLVPREEFFPPNRTVEQVNEANAQMFRDSQSAAEIAALNYLDYPSVVYAGDIPAGSPSAGILQPQDQITAIDDTKVTDSASLVAALSTTVPGQVVTVSIVRAGKPMDVKVTLGEGPDKTGRGYLGIVPTERPVAPFTITISLADIGGPSAGLMFTLGIIDKLSPGDLPDGRFVAGTGEIDLQPNPADSPKVGAIGGILMKMISAKDAGASVFLVPEANCQEAVTRVPAGLQLVKVGTLDEAMAALKTLAAGGTPPGC